MSRQTVTLRDVDALVLDPAATATLPGRDTLTTSQFHSILPCLSSNPSSPPAFGFPALQNWYTKLLANLRLQHADAHHPYHAHPYKLRSIDIQSVDWFSPSKIGFMKLRAKIETDPYLHRNESEPRADWLPGAVFLRGGSVAMLIILQSSSSPHKYVLFTIQPRIPACSLSFPELPAGMLDCATFTGAAASEIKQEAHLTVHEHDLINLSTLASPPSSESLPAAIYPSPGACDEFIPIFLAQKRLTERHMQWLNGRATGLRDEGERITLRLVPLEKAWKVGARDGKTLAALALYEGLRAEGKVPEMPEEVEEEPEEMRGAEM